MRDTTRMYSIFSDMTPDQYIGQRLRIALKIRGVSQRRLARVLDVTPATVSKYCRGLSSIRINHLMLAANYLGVNLEDLIEGVDVTKTNIPPVRQGAEGRDDQPASVVRPKGFEPLTF